MGGGGGILRGGVKKKILLCKVGGLHEKIRI